MKKFVLITLGLLSLPHVSYAMEAKGKIGAQEDEQRDRFVVSRRGTFSIPYTITTSPADMEAVLESGGLPCNIVEVTQKNVDVEVGVNRRGQIEHTILLPVEFPLDLHSLIMARFSGCRDLEAGLDLRAPRFGCMEGRSGPYRVDHELRMTLYHVLKGISDLRQSLMEELNKSLPVQSEPEARKDGAKEKKEEKAAGPAVVPGEKEKEIEQKKSRPRKKPQRRAADAAVAANAAAFAQKVLSAEAALSEKRTSELSLPYLKRLFENMGGTVDARMKKKKILTMQVTVRGHGLTLSSKGRKTDLKRQVQRFLQELSAARN